MPFFVNNCTCPRLFYAASYKLIIDYTIFIANEQKHHLQNVII